MSGQIVAYVRVSSADQNPDWQLAAVGEVERAFQDKKSGRNIQERPELGSLLGHVRRGDTVRIASMDRLARSVADLAQLVTGLTERGVRVEFVKECLTFAAEESDFLATFQLHLMGAFAQMERAISKDRQREGIDLARARGAYLGRGKTFDRRRHRGGPTLGARGRAQSGHRPPTRVPPAGPVRRVEQPWRLRPRNLAQVAGAAQEVELPL